MLDKNMNQSGGPGVQTGASYHMEFGKPVPIARLQQSQQDRPIA